MPGVVVQIDGYDPIAGAAVSLLAGSHDDPAVCHLNGQTWFPALLKLPTLRYDLFDGAFGGEITAPASSLKVSVEPWPNFGRYSLADARLRLWTGNVGDAFANWTLRFDGRVTEQPESENGAADISFAVDDRWLDGALLTPYAGTTGGEGPADLKGQPKPLAIGAPRYVPGTLVDQVNTIFQVSGYGAINAVEMALEKLARFGAASANYTSYAALAAATVPPGTWATAKAVGMARLGAPPTGQISFLVQGDASGADGWARKPGQIVRRLAALSGGVGRTDDASLNALDTAKPYNLSIYVDQQTSARPVIQSIAASVNAVAGLSWIGKLFVAPVGIAAPGMTLAADGSSLPPVTGVKQVAIASPFKKLAIGAERAVTVHQLGDIAFTATLVDMGVYAAGTTYREGNIVQFNGSSWLYINPTPSAGNAPAAGSSFWSVLAQAGKDGVSAYAVIQSNENHIVPANADGSVISYNGAMTSVQVIYSGADVSSSFALSVPSGGNPQALAYSINDRTITVTGGLDAGEPNALLQLSLTGSGSFAGTILNTSFSLTKSRAGADGTSPPLVSLTASPAIVRFDKNNAVYPGQSITYTSIRQNTTAVPVFNLYKEDGTLIDSRTAAGYAAVAPGAWSTSGPDNLVEAATDVPGVIALGGGSGFIMEVVVGTIADRVSIKKVRDGADGASALTAFLTNQDQTLPATADGTVTSYAGASGNFVVFSGSADVSGLFSLATSSNPQGLTVNYSGMSYTVAGGLDAGEPSAQLTIRASGSGAYAGVSVDQVFTLGKSKAGADGTAPPLISLAANPAIIRFDEADAVYSGQSVTFTATRQNTTATPVFTLRKEDGTLIDSRTAAGYAAAAPGAWSTTGPDNLTEAASDVPGVIALGGGSGYIMEVSASGVADRVTIKKVRDGAHGADAVAWDLSTQSITVEATYAGATKAGQLPRTIKATVRKGGSVDVTSAATVTMTPTNSSIVLGAVGSDGSAQVNTADAPGYVDVAVSYAGVSLGSKRVEIKRPRDASPPQTAQQQTVNTSANSPFPTSFPATPNGGVVTIAANGSGQIKGDMVSDYSGAPSNFQFMLAYASGGSGWTAMGASENGTAATPGASGEPAEPGSGSMSRTQGGLTAGGAYSIGLFYRRILGTVTAAINTSLTGSTP